MDKRHFENKSNKLQYNGDCEKTIINISDGG